MLAFDPASSSYVEHFGLRSVNCFSVFILNMLYGTCYILLGVTVGGWRLCMEQRLMNTLYYFLKHRTCIKIPLTPTLTMALKMHMMSGTLQ